jgi:hypothetical protein
MTAVASTATTMRPSRWWPCAFCRDLVVNHWHAGEGAGSWVTELHWCGSRYSFSSPGDVAPAAPPAPVAHDPGYRPLVAAPVHDFSHLADAMVYALWPLPKRRRAAAVSDRTLTDLGRCA